MQPCMLSDTSSGNDPGNQCSDSGHDSGNQCNDSVNDSGKQCSVFVAVSMA